MSKPRTDDRTAIGSNGFSILGMNPAGHKNPSTAPTDAGPSVLPALELTPLVIDLDGTLTPSDTLAESILILFKQHPLTVFLLPFWLMLGRSRFKERVAKEVAFSTLVLPWREDLLVWLRVQRHSGRKLILATAAHESIAQEVSRQLGIFDMVLATTSDSNLKGEVKLRAIQKGVGQHFAYAGDSKADLPIWHAAKAAVLVGVSATTRRAVTATTPIEMEFASSPVGWRDWLLALRVHQWVKNTLLFVPLFTAFAFTDIGKVGNALLAFFVFSIAASATYILNDLWDLESDRQHPRKKNRPFASAHIPLLQGVVGAGILLVLALTLALYVSSAFAGMLLGYVVLTTAYSWALKHYVLIDVLMLALLYTFRVLAGAVATNIIVTPWLLAFSVFTFFSLALVKRCAELVDIQKTGRQGAHGRDYQISDLAVLWPLGIGASLCSVVVFGLFIGSPGTMSRYGYTNALWLVGVGLIYWVSRLWIKTSRGEMHDDPIVFALRDFGSRVTVLAMLTLTLLAHFLG